MEKPEDYSKYFNEDGTEKKNPYSVSGEENRYWHEYFDDHQDKIARMLFGKDELKAYFERKAKRGILARWNAESGVYS